MRLYIFGLILFLSATSILAQSSADIAGEWTNGRVSMLQEYDPVKGTTTPGNSTYFSYKFTADGKFAFIGMAKTTNFGCSQTLFNDKSGKFVIDGSTITLIPSKNFWRNSFSCFPSRNSEKNYTLTKETYELSTKTDEYGKELVCLANDKGESCYRKEN